MDQVRCLIGEDEDNVGIFGSSVTGWQSLNLNNQTQFFVDDFSLESSVLNSDACVTMDDLGASQFHITTSLGMRTFSFSEQGESWALLYKTVSELSFIQNGEQEWSLPLNGEGVAQPLRNSNFEWMYWCK